MQNTSMKSNQSELTIDDLKDKISFESWIKKSLDMADRFDVPGSNLLIYLNYIMGIIKDNKEIDIAFWYKLTKELEKNIEKGEKK